MTSNNKLVDIYMASLWRQGHVIKTIKSLLLNPEFGTATISCNNYTDEQWGIVNKELNDSRIILHRTNNEKGSNEKLKFIAVGDNYYICLADDLYSKRLSELEFPRTSVLDTNPELEDEWDLEKNGGITLANVSYMSNRKMWWKCKMGHSWQTVVANRTRHKAGSCPICRGIMSKIRSATPRQPRQAQAQKTSS